MSKEQLIILEVKNLYFAYTQDNFVLSNISLQLCKGDKLVILGPNGGGKSTLLSCIATLQQATSGDIIYNGSYAPYYKSALGYVPQYSTHNSNLLISVLDVVLLGKVTLFMSTQEKARMRAYARHLLELVSLIDKEGELFTALSGGEKQRVLLARALLCKPALLLLDEPTASVDPKSRFCFYELLSQLDADISIIMTTHDITALDTSFTKLAVVNTTIDLYDDVTMTHEIVHKLYGKQHDHLCAINTFVEKLLS